MADNNRRRPAADEAEGSRAGARRRLIQWNPTTAIAAHLAAADDSSGSSSRPRPDQDLPYSDSDARRFKQERDETRQELEVVSKQAGIAELEWEDQRKQLLETIDARDAELNRLRALANSLADKVNARGDTPEARLGAVTNRIDEVASHGIRLGTAVGLIAMSTHTGTDYSRLPVGFANNDPDDSDEIEAVVDSLDTHANAIADSIHPQSVLNRLFH